MLGYSLVTKQTPPAGVVVRNVMVAQALDLKRETYFAILMDRDSNGPVMVGSPEGGVDIEEVAEKSPNLIFKEPIDIVEGLTDEKATKMAKNLGFKGPLVALASEQMKRLYDLFISVDAVQVEVNPFGETPDGQVVSFDAKINFDDNAAFRQKEIFDMRDPAEEDPREVIASKYNLNYIGMDGNIGCLVNGAGLAMATMDIIQHHGGKPANFLDVGGGATAKQVMEAFKIITNEPDVNCILVNIFGGIMRCDVIAEGIINAAKHLDLRVPVVVRLAGTRVEEAKALISQSRLDILTSENLDDAAMRAVECAKIVKTARNLGLLVTFKEIKSIVQDNTQITPKIN